MARSQSRSFALVVAIIGQNMSTFPLFTRLTCLTSDLTPLMLKIHVVKQYNQAFGQRVLNSAQQVLNGTLHAPSTASQSGHVSVKIIESHVVELSELLCVALFGRSVVRRGGGLLR